MVQFGSESHVHDAYLSELLEQILAQEAKLAHARTRRHNRKEIENLVGFLNLLRREYRESSATIVELPARGSLTYDDRSSTKSRIKINNEK